MNQERIGKFISKLRKEKKLTQEDLAEKLKVSSKSISRWETGKCMPDISLLIPLSEILEVSVNELITGEHIEEKNIKEKSEAAIKETINYSNSKLKREKKKLIFALIFILLSLSIIFGTVDYNRIKYGYDPIFMIRITPSSKTIHHYIGLGYRVERKVGVSPYQPFINSDYVRFGPWLFTSEMKIIKAEPNKLIIRGNSQEIEANRGSYCWTEEHLSVCSDTLPATSMVYKEELNLSKKEMVIITNPYGKITSVEAYISKNQKQDNGGIIEEPVLYNNLEYNDTLITMPDKEGTYYIVINIEAEEGDVWHSFKVNIKN
jgi:transcriptional regulator with XRE-family HTH domain